MQLTSLFTLLATGLALVAAQESVDTTTTSTSTLTQTVTITKCNPTATNCPLRTNTTTVASSTWSFPQKNSTVSAGPTAYSNTTSYQIPTSKATTSPSQTPVTTTTKPATTSPTTVASSGAGSLMAQSGLLLGVLGAGVALLA